LKNPIDNNGAEMIYRWSEVKRIAKDQKGKGGGEIGVE
jgi:hypothetical protein